MPIAAEINGRLYAIHTDHLNTPRRLTNQQGQVAWQWLISGFGEVRPTTGDRGYGQTVSGPSYAQAVKFDLRYPGQVFDEETGLSYNLHRYYDAATGRYMQADPIGLAGIIGLGMWDATHDYTLICLNYVFEKILWINFKTWLYLRLHPPQIATCLGRSGYSSHEFNSSRVSNL